MKQRGERADIFTLSSGRTLSANLGIIGIDDELSTYGGYDQILEIQFDATPLNREERAELAAFMIERWKCFAQEGPTNG